MKESIPIFLSSDSRYAPYMSALMISIMDHTKSDVTFYVLDGGMGTHVRSQIVSLQGKWNFGLEFINIEDYRHLFRMPAAPAGSITRSSSDRFIIPFIKPRLDKAIILDVDMIALGDVRELWNVDLEGKLLGAVPVYCWTSMDELRRHAQNIGMSMKHVYFNMGTMLVDLKKWREEDVTTRISSFKIKFDTNKNFWWDEIILNLLLQNNHYKIIDPKYNMMIPHQAYLQCGKPEAHRELIEDYAGLPPDHRVDEIIFSHFAMRGVKPWNVTSYMYPPVKKKIKIPNFNDFWHYMKLTPFYDGELVSFIDTRIRSISFEINLLGDKLMASVLDGYRTTQGEICTLGDMLRKGMLDSEQQKVVEKRYREIRRKYRLNKIVSLLTFGLLCTSRVKKYEEVLKEMAKTIGLG